MSDPGDPLLALSAADPADEAAREARHELIGGLLAAHGDRELPPETASQIDAHLVGCARCRREVQLHQAVRSRLAAEPTAAAAPALRARIAEAVSALPASRPSAPRPALRWRAAVFAAVLGLALVAVALLAPAGRRDADGAGRIRSATTAVTSDALLGAVIADYRRVMAQDLPGRARDLDAVRGAMPFAVAPLQAAELRLLAAWTTRLDGEPAAVLAYRWGDRLVVQYLVSDAHFFGSPALRTGVAAAHLVSARDGSVSVLAWPTASAGTLLLGEVPPERLAALWAAARVAERVGGGAH